MEFTQLTFANASKYTGKKVVFHLNRVPTMAKFLCVEKTKGFVLELDGGRTLIISYKSPAYVVENKEDPTIAKNNLYFTMNFVLLTSINALQYIGYPVIVKNNGLNKIRKVHKTKTYISVQSGTKELEVYIDRVPCYVIV